MGRVKETNKGWCHTPGLAVAGSHCNPRPQGQEAGAVTGTKQRASGQELFFNEG